MAIYKEASDVSEPFWMHLLSSKMQDVSDECQLILMPPKKSYSKDDASFK
jgi:hypothetical protein